jgi:Trypsin-like peptidase domain
MRLTLLPLRLALFAAFVVVATCVGATPALSQSPTVSPAAVQLDPGLFSQIASGVVLIRGFDCSGSAKISGTGFLVGTGVVMTARHVVNPSGAEAGDACKVKVQVDGHWVAAKRVSWWYRSADPTGRETDLATLKLAKPANPLDYIFTFRDASPRVGTNLSIIGHPLGLGLSLTQGTLVLKHHFNGVPMLFIRLLGAQGSSGSPIVDNTGSVVGVLQLGFGGGETSGLMAGVDLSSWWGNGHKVAQTLCHAYPNGGIANCTSPTPPTAPPTPTPTPPPPPAPTYTIAGCWVQNTGASWANVSPSGSTSTFATSDLLANGPSNYWTVLQLTAAPQTVISGVTLALIAPNGVASTSAPFDWTAGDPDWAYALDWTSNTTGAYFFQDPAFLPPQQWIFRWQFPNGLSCDAPFIVTP